MTKGVATAPGYGGRDNSSSRRCSVWKNKFS